MNTLREDLVVWHGVENIRIIARMSEDTQSREGDCQIACFDSSLPQIVHMDYRRNHEDELKLIWQSWDNAKKMHFQDKYGNVAKLLFVKLDNALLKAMIQRLEVDPTLQANELQKAREQE
ncbi:hypothetical protein J1N35_041509 [Gossypium stocksii]|uniref:Uncharacterized protein n=1 Tax=Gossypium stocksii TaxID=47602 RepID=A0A9D3UFW3_9ROSI|nr:hypothetical protein J1N35_041509 [Gossypium stocksii]